MLFHSANLSYWIFLGIGILLFLLVIISGGGDDELDLETDVELDADVDIDADTDLDSDGEIGSLQLIAWLGFGKAPLMLLLAIDFSIWGLTGWMLNVLVGNLTGNIPTNLIGLAGLIFLISLSFSLFTGSFIARPLGKIFASFGEDVSSSRLLGCLGVVTSKEIPYERENKIAHADITDNAHNLVTVAVCLPSWAQVIPQRNQKIIIIEQNPDYYLAIAKDSIDETKWLSN